MFHRIPSLDLGHMVVAPCPIDTHILEHVHAEMAVFAWPGNPDTRLDFGHGWTAERRARGQIELLNDGQTVATVPAWGDLGALQVAAFLSL